MTAPAPNPRVYRDSRRQPPLCHAGGRGFDSRRSRPQRPAVRRCGPHCVHAAADRFVARHLLLTTFAVRRARLSGALGNRAPEAGSAGGGSPGALERCSLPSSGLLDTDDHGRRLLDDRIAEQARVAVARRPTLAARPQRASRAPDQTRSLVVRGGRAEREASAPACARKEERAGSWFESCQLHRMCALLGHAVSGAVLATSDASRARPDSAGAAPPRREAPYAGSPDAQPRPHAGFHAGFHAGTARRPLSRPRLGRRSRTCVTAWP